ncbi:MAG: DUF2281 domain-containing protein [Spirochaetes bacterium]|nr:DUF2281 domain-containing protein [Spirochaetota bacterium]
MTIEQIIEVPANRRITIDVPREVPVGRAVIAFTLARQEPRGVPVFGCAKGQFKMAADFDEPLDDFKDYM